MFRKFLAFILFTGLSFAKPVVPTGSIVSAASYLPSGLPNSGIAQGSIFSVFGTGLGPNNPVSATSFPLPTVLPATSGTSMKIAVGETTTDAIIFFTAAGQVNALLPSKTPTGDGTLTLTYNGETSDPTPIHVVESTFAAFTPSEAGSGPAIVTTATYALNTMLASAKPNDVVILWGTGLGPVTGDETQGATAADLTKQLSVQVYVGGQAVTPLYAGRSPGFAGLDQINFKVPAGVDGCALPIAVRAGGLTGAFTTMSVATNGGKCSDPVGVTGQALDKVALGKNVNLGLILLTRLSPEVNLPGIGNLTVDQDVGNAYFYSYTPTEFLGSRGLSTLSAFDSCEIWACSGPNCTPQPQPLGGTLDAGPSLTVSGPNGQKSLALTNPGSPGTYSAVLATGGIAGTPYLDPGSYTVSGPGGSGANKVGSFNANETIGASPLTWKITSTTSSNSSGTTVIPLSSDLKLQWSGGDPNGYVVIIGASSTDVTANAPQATTTFGCTVKGSANQFTVPSWLLSSVPVSGTLTQAGITISNGFLLMGSFTAFKSFTALGLDLAFIANVVLQGQNVQFQ